MEDKSARGLRQFVPFLHTSTMPQCCPHCKKLLRTTVGVKVHIALSKKCRAIREQKEEEDTDSESFSTSSTSSSLDSDSPLLPSRNPFFKFFKCYRKDRTSRTTQQPSERSDSRSSLDSANSSSLSTADLPSEPFLEFHPTAADTYGRGKTVFEEMHESDQFAEQRKVSFREQGGLGGGGLAH